MQIVGQPAQIAVADERILGQMPVGCPGVPSIRVCVCVCKWKESKQRK